MSRLTPAATNPSRVRRKVFICLLLAGVTLAIYWPARHYGIVYYDDPFYLTGNAMVKSGLNWHSLWWALSSVVAANWHPVTNLSFVLDAQLWGINPGAEHLVNVVLHALNAVLLFLVLERMTRSRRGEATDEPSWLNCGKPGPAREYARPTTNGIPFPSTWRCAAVAALFAWHPLRVESVAWISERKDVLSVFFFLLTLLCYAKAVTRDECRVARTGAQNVSPVTCHLSPFYWLALIFFALGLMSKAMLVTLPFALLLLDFWPLRRFAIYDLPVLRSNTAEGGRFKIAPVLREKIPFFVLTAIFCAVTYEVQKEHAAMTPFERLGLGDRVSNAIISCLRYLAKFFQPADLAVIYPLPRSFDAREVWLTAGLLLAISLLCLGQLFRRPYLAMGWFWYLGTLVPVIGLVQVGNQAMADRYTYIPLIGPVISLVWLAAEELRTAFARRFLLLPATVLLLAASAVLARHQVQLWASTERLFEHAIAVTGDNPPAQYCLAVGLEHEGRITEAISHYRIQAALAPQDYRPHYSLARLFEKEGRKQQALAEYDAVVTAGANPDDDIARLNLADALSHLGRASEAVFQLNEALRIKPDSPEAMNNLAWFLATSPDADARDGSRAVQLAGRACALTGFKQTIFVGTLAAAYAEAGRFDEAVATAEKAIALAQQNGEPDLLQKNRELLEWYRARQPYHESQ